MPRRPTGAEARTFLRRLVRQIRSHWPRVELLIRANSHYCAPEVLEFCRAARIDFVLGVATTTTLRGHVDALEASTASRHAGTPAGETLRRHQEFYACAASWSRVERIIARVEAGPQGADTRFVVTNLAAGSARGVYEDLYCRRGQAENHIKAWTRHLAADRTSCMKADANQLRLMLHTGAYWLLWSLRSLMPKRSTWRVAQLDTLRLVKLATRVVALKTRVMLHLPSACRASPAVQQGRRPDRTPKTQPSSPAICTHKPPAEPAEIARAHIFVPGPLARHPRLPPKLVNYNQISRIVTDPPSVAGAVAAVPLPSRLAAPHLRRAPFGASVGFPGRRF